MSRSRLPFRVFSERAGLKHDQIPAIGIGFGGPVDSALGRTQKSYQVAGWDDFPLAEWVANQLGVRSCRPRKRRRHGRSRRMPVWRRAWLIRPSSISRSAAESAVRSIVDDRIYRGAGSGATEIGHLRVPCQTGPRRRLARARARGLRLGNRRSRARARSAAKRSSIKPNWVVLAIAGGDPAQITAESVAAAAAAGDPQSRAILETARAAFAFALTQAIALLAPRRIVIGGGVSLIGERDWFDPIRRLTDRDVFPPFRGQLRHRSRRLWAKKSSSTVPSRSRDDALELGAASMTRSRDASGQACCDSTTLRNSRSPSLTLIVTRTHY